MSFLAESQLSIWLCLMPSPSTNKRREKEKKQLKWEMAPLLLNTVKEPSHEKCQKEKKKEKKKEYQGIQPGMAELEHKTGSWPEEERSDATHGS